MNAQTNTPAPVEFPSALNGANFRLPMIAKQSAPMIAEGIWSKIMGEDYGKKSDNVKLLIEALRKVRDDNKPAPQRKLRTPQEALEQSIGKSLSDLGAINVGLFGGTLSVNISTLFRHATDIKSPLHFEALRVVLEKGIHLEEKKATRGKAKLILAKGKFPVSTMEEYEATEDSALVAKAVEFFAKQAEAQAPVAEPEAEGEQQAA